MLLNIFLFYIHLFFCISENAPYSLDYTYDGSCPLSTNDTENDFCLPTGNSSIIQLLKTRQETMNCAEALNDLLSDYTTDIYFKKSSEDNHLSLYARSYINANELLLNINTKSMITNGKIDRKVAFPGLNQKDFFYKEIEFETSPNGFKEEFKFIHNFFVHLAFINHYQLKADLLCLPVEVDIPFFTLTPYEITEIMSDEIRNFYPEKKELKDHFFYFRKIMALNYSPDERRMLFFGENEVSLENFMYGVYIIKSRIYFDDETKTIYLPTFIHHMKTDNTLILKNGPLISYEFKEDKLLIKNKKKYIDNNEIFRNLPSILNRNMLLFKGVIPEENDFNCVLIKYFDDSIAKEMKIETTHCIKIPYLFQIRYWFLMVTLMNLDAKAQRKCQEYLQYSFTDKKKESERALDELVDGKFCPYVKWQKKNPWEKLQNIIKDGIEAMKKNRDLAQEYIGLRKEAGLVTVNAQLIKKYYEKTQEYFERIGEEFKFYEDLNNERTKNQKVEL